MARLPSAFVIDAAKLRNYLLDIEHPVGKSKAAFFMRCGFAPARAELLADCLFAHAVADHFVEDVVTPFGTKFIFEGSIRAPVGEVTDIRSVWIARADVAFAELVTAYRF